MLAMMKGEKMNPIDFEGQKSKVKVTIHESGNNLCPPYIKSAIFKVMIVIQLYICNIICTVIKKSKCLQALFRVAYVQQLT